MSKTVALFGDANLMGIDYNEDNTELNYIENNFAKIIQEEENVKIINYSLIGLNSQKALLEIKKILAIDSTFEYAAIGVCNNDCDYVWSEVEKDPLKNHKPITSKEEYIGNIDKIITLLKKNKIEPIIVNSPPINPYRYFAHLVNKGKDGKTLLSAMGTIKQMASVQTEYNIALTEYARINNLKIIDLNKAFMETEDFNKYLGQDGAHINEAGQAILASELLKIIRA